MDLPQDEGEGIESSEEPDRPVAVGLPMEAEGWTRFEKDLYLLSEGEYHPGEMARMRRVAQALGSRAGTGASQEVQGRVSVVSPTMSSRRQYHEQLWACFEAQDWEDKELIIVETYEDEASEFLQKKAKEDDRLVHICFQRAAGEDFSVGLKRDMTLHLASGSAVCNFDDDDIYAPSYISAMVGEMQSRGLVALTLSSWYNYIVPRKVCAYSDPSMREASMDREELDEVLYGYGFSYVHRRRESLLFPYPDVRFAEDAPFLLGLRERYGDERVALRRDEAGICMHIVHRNNSTGTDGESLSRELEQSELDSLTVAASQVFKEFLELHVNADEGSWWRLLRFDPWSTGLLSPTGPEEDGEGEDKATEVAAAVRPFSSWDLSMLQARRGSEGGPAARLSRAVACI